MNYREAVETKRKARNGKTGKNYNGLNALWLYLLAEHKGYTDPRWVTYQQAKDLKASVKAGEKSSNVFYWSWYDKKTKKPFDDATVKDMSKDERQNYLDENVRPVLKYYQVFNASQCNNFPKLDVAEQKEMPADERARQNATIESIIANSAAPVYYDGGNRAYYSPRQDSIHLPEINRFHTMQDYYATALHEIAHSTGHESRLNRKMIGVFGTSEYAKEELRAELASVFMQLDYDISVVGKHFENHAAYLQSWLKSVRDDQKEFFAALTDAEKISQYVGEHYLHENEVEAALVAAAENTREKYQLDFRLPFSNEFLLREALKQIGYQRDFSVEDENLKRSSAAVESNLPQWTNVIRFIGTEGKTIEGLYERTNNGVVLEATDITGFTTNGLTQNEANQIADIVRGFDVEVDMKQIQHEEQAATKVIVLEPEEAAEYLRGVEINERRKAADNEIYGLIYDWKGLKEENSLYTGKQLKELDAAFVPEDRYDGAIAANKTYMAIRLTGKTQEETDQNVRDFLTGKYNEAGDMEYIEGWYWETVDENFFTGEKNETTLKYIDRLNIPSEDLRMKEEYAIEQRQKKIDKIVYDIVNEGTENTTQGNWIINFDQFGEDETFVRENIEDIVEALNKREEVADVIIDENGIDTNYYTNYCPNLDEKIGDEENYVEQAEQVGQVGQVRQAEWYSIDLTPEQIGNEYGNNVMIHMPQGEYSSFVFFAPKKLLHGGKDGTKKLSVRADWSYKLQNDGLQVELNGSELRAAYAGKEVGKSAKRVAPRKRNRKRLDDLEANVPDAMKSLKNWCVFRTKYNPETERQDKFVISPMDGKWAKTNDPDTWVDFETAIKYAEENDCAGLSFALDGKCGITCIDLDKSISKDGKLTESAEKLTQELAETYTETSVSGNGIHIFVADDILRKTYKNRADLPDGEIEVYDSGRFISMTGNMRSKSNALSNCPTATMTWLHGTLGKKIAERENKPRGGVGQSGNDVIERIRRSKRGHDFDTLMSGGAITGDKSRDDMILLNMLAFFTDCDRAQMESIFLSSGRRADLGANGGKKSSNYLSRSIEKACSSLKTRISPAAIGGAGRAGTRNR